MTKRDGDKTFKIFPTIIFIRRLTAKVRVSRDHNPRNPSNAASIRPVALDNSHHKVSGGWQKYAVVDVCRRSEWAGSVLISEDVKRLRIEASPACNTIALRQLLQEDSQNMGDRLWAWAFPPGNLLSSFAAGGSAIWFPLHTWDWGIISSVELLVLYSGGANWTSLNSSSLILYLYRIQFNQLQDGQWLEAWTDFKVWIH